MAHKITRLLLNVSLLKYTHLKPLDGVSFGDLVLVTDLGTLRLALRHAVSWAVKYDVKVHSVDAWTGNVMQDRMERGYIDGSLAHPVPTRTFCCCVHTPHVWTDK